jgi:lysophospholipase L1-like esterase
MEIMKAKIQLLFFSIAIIVNAAIAQQTPQQSPAPQPLTAIIPSTGFPGLDHYRASRIQVYMNDFGELARYRDANASLFPPAAGEERVVFFGDSITDGWKLEESFPGKHYVNRGISGQTTSQMLVRFRQDVVNLRPKVVVILAGTNDIAGNGGPIANQDIEANYSDIAELAKANHIRVIFASILPVNNYTERAKDFFAQRPTDRILALNRWLKDYCERNHLRYLDYFGAMVDEKGMLKRELADDGLHPNQAGYAIMAPMAEKAIAKSQ